MNSGQDSSIDKKMMTLKAIWGSIIFSVVAAGAAGYFIAVNGIVPPLIEGDMALNVIMGLGGVAAIMIFASYKISGMIAGARGSRGPGSFESDEKMVQALFTRYLQVCVIRWAIFETVGMMGLFCLLLGESAT